MRERADIPRLKSACLTSDHIDYTPVPIRHPPFESHNGLAVEHIFTCYSTMSPDSVISNRLAKVQQQLSHIQQTLIEIQHELRQRTANQPESLDTPPVTPPRRHSAPLLTNAPRRSLGTGLHHDTDSETADSVVSNEQVQVGMRRPASPGGQAADVSGSGACQPSPQPGAHLEVAARGSIDDLFSDTEWASLKGKGGAKRPPNESFSDSETEPPQKKRRLVKGIRPPSGRSSDGEKEQPPSKLRRLTKGVRPSRQTEQPEDSSDTTEEAGTYLYYII